MAIKLRFLYKIHVYMNPCEKVYFDDACIHFILVFNEVIPLKFGQSSSGVPPRLCHRSPYRMRGE